MLWHSKTDKSFYANVRFCFEGSKWGYVTTVGRHSINIDRLEHADLFVTCSCYYLSLPAKMF